MERYWDTLFWGNTLRDWAITLSIILGGLLLLRLIRLIVLKRLQVWSNRTATGFDDFLIRLFKNAAIPLLYLGVINAGIGYLSLPVRATQIIHTATLVVVVFYVIRMISDLLGYAFQRFAGQVSSDPAQAKQARGILLIIKVILWIIGFIFLIDNLGYDITTIITGLGIGGIAIALAAQTILGDLFSYLVIFFDKPFETDDFVIVGNHSGIVEYIGIKTTRLRTLGGEQLIVSNTDLTNSRVQNFKRMERRRVLFQLRITYDTGAKQLRRIPALVRDIITALPETQFDRAHLASLAESCIQFEIVYYIRSADYVKFMNTQEAVCLGIYETFEREGIEFAYPTQKLLWESAASSQPIHPS